MNIIEKVKQHGLDFDNSNHDVLYRASKDIQGVYGMVCEIGFRMGGGMGVMMMGCIETKNSDRYFIAVDPYGHILYNAQEGNTLRFDYTNSMKSNTLINMSKFCLENNIIFDLITLEDSEFFKRYGDGVPFYNMNKQIINTYALVHLDGPHHLKDILSELDFFCGRVSIGGYIVIDDVTYFDLFVVDEYLKNKKFILMEKDNQKISYKKIL